MTTGECKFDDDGCSTPDAGNKVTLQMCPPPCEHEWTGNPEHSTFGSSLTCSKCGVRAIDVDQMRLP